MDGVLYSGWLEEDTKHSISRAKERAGYNRKKAVKMMDLARTRGVRSEECRWSVDRKFLESKSDEQVVAVAFNGFCFVLDRDTMHCITMFSLPKCFGQKKTYYKSNDKKRYLENFDRSNLCYA